MNLLVQPHLELLQPLLTTRQQLSWHLCSLCRRLANAAHEAHVLGLFLVVRAQGVNVIELLVSELAGVVTILLGLVDPLVNLVYIRYPLLCYLLYSPMIV